MEEGFSPMLNILNQINKLDDYIGKQLTYKQICEITGIPKKTSNSKLKQINQIESIYNIEKAGMKYCILSRKKNATFIYDRRSKGSNSKFIDDIEVVLLSAMKKSNTISCIYSLSEALKLTCLTNDNYSVSRSHIGVASDVLEVPEEYMYSFYNKTNKKLRETFERSLNRMQDKALIFWTKEKMVMLRGNSNDQSGICRPATELELEHILRIESEAIHRLNCCSKQDVLLSGNWNKYKSIIAESLKKETAIYYYFDAYKITSNKAAIDKLDLTEREDVVKERINKAMLEALKKAVHKPLDGLDEELDFEYEDFNRYVLTNIKIIDALIDVGTPINIRATVDNLFGREGL